MKDPLIILIFHKLLVCDKKLAMDDELLSPFAVRVYSISKSFQQ